MIFLMPLKDYFEPIVDVVAPHARKKPFSLMSYVKDFNEWFAPAAQMAIDEYEGEENYPAWQYLIASAPILGKVMKPISKVIKRKPIGNILDDYGKIKITVPNEVDVDHLAEVSKEMEEFGRPVIRAVYDPVYDSYIAFEGSHRVKAAHDKGIKPILDVVDINDVYEGKYPINKLTDDLEIRDQEELEKWLDNAYRRINEGLEFEFD